MSDSIKVRGIPAVVTGEVSWDSCFQDFTCLAGVVLATSALASCVCWQSAGRRTCCEWASHCLGFLEDQAHTGIWAWLWRENSAILYWKSYQYQNTIKVNQNIWNRFLCVHRVCLLGVKLIFQSSRGKWTTAGRESSAENNRPRLNISKVKLWGGKWFCLQFHNFTPLWYDWFLCW